VCRKKKWRGGNDFTALNYHRPDASSPTVGCIYIGGLCRSRGPCFSGRQTGGLGAEPDQRALGKRARLARASALVAGWRSRLRAALRLTLIKFRLALALLAVYLCRVCTCWCVGSGCRDTFTDLADNFKGRRYLSRSAMAGFACLLPLAATSNKLFHSQSWGPKAQAAFG